MCRAHVRVSALSLVLEGENRSGNTRKSMARDINEDLLAHYVTGECTEEEKAEIEAWIQADPARQQLVQELRHIWQEAARADTRDVDAMWTSLARRMKLRETETDSSRAERRQRQGSSVTYRQRSRQPLGRYQPIRTTVLIVLVAAAAFMIGQIIGGPTGITEKAAMRQVTTEAGERARVELGDGTHVMLNAQSTLTLPTKFTADRRSVQLEGEAYFHVAPNTDRPFVVRAGGTLVRVLGTRFNVGAYSDDADVQVVVAEGKVAVRPEDADDTQELLLTRHQMGRFSKTGKRAERREVNADRYLAWTEGQLVFKDAPFQQIARKLERRYDVQIKLDGAPDDVDRLNASFKEEPLAEVLSIIAESLQLHYERNAGEVTFSPASGR